MEAEEAQGVRVWLGRVPPGLCVGEEPVRELFRSVGELLSVQIHHDFADMSAEGFVFLTFATAEAAEAAVCAVASGALDPENRYNGVMQARVALRRGGAPTALERDEDTVDLLLGRRLGNALSQPGAGDDGDDDLRLLQSLSQSAFSQPSSQLAGGSKLAKARGKGRPKAKTTTKPLKLEDGGGGGKRRRKARANSFLSPA